MLIDNISFCAGRTGHFLFQWVKQMFKAGNFIHKVLYSASPPPLMIYSAISESTTESTISAYYFRLRSHKLGQDSKKEVAMSL